MPKGTKVHRCVESLKSKPTHATGRPLRGKAKAKARRGRDRKRNWEEFTR